MSKYTKLANNSLIFGLASIGSYLISFLFVRFYTEYLTREQYGIIDFLITTVALLIPITTLSISDAVFRFSMEKKKNEKVICNGFFVLLIGGSVFVPIGFLCFFKTIYYEYYGVFCLLLFLSCIDNLLAQYIKGIGLIKIFAKSGIIKSLVLVGCNIVFIYYCQLDVSGYLLAAVISETASLVFLFMASHCFRGLVISIEKNLLQEMLKYAIPLMPNSLSWWIMNAADKYTIVIVLGNEYNGIYAVAHKLPTLINLCSSLFFQAWQISAVEECDSDEKEKFYSEVFNILSLVMLLLTSLLFLFIKPIMNMLTSDAFNEAWQYSPFLILGMVFAAFSSFLGAYYIASKKTKGVFKTSVIGAITNLVLDAILIQCMGMTGTAIATMLGFLVTWLLRVYETNKVMQVKYKRITLTISILLLIIQAILIVIDFKYCIFSGICVTIFVSMVYRNEFLTVVKRLFVFLGK